MGINLGNMYIILQNGGGKKKEAKKKRLEGHTKPE